LLLNFLRLLCRDRSTSAPSADDRKPTTGSYQDDFETPGISPLKASPRKHKRHTPNLRR
jgi:hypothetical protein